MTDTTTNASSMEVDEVSSTWMAGVEARTPQIGDRVYKDECTYCFDNAYSENGLLISLHSFFAVCTTHIEWFRNFEDNTGFLKYRKVKGVRQESGEPSIKVQKLSVNAAPDDFIDKYTVVVYPHLETERLIETLPLQIIESASGIIAANLSANVFHDNWDGDQRPISENARNLEQLPTILKLPTSGWQCGEYDCDINVNLWINLTDGAIRCGRMQVTNSGETLPGRGHAREHFFKTGFPIAVKLGTIANNDADTFDYLMDDNCIDPKLAEHLAHFGLDINTLEKTEKSTLELELDLNQKWEWSRCCEDGVSLESVFGPGFTGIVNIGSSCYINSVLQILSQTKNLVQTYGDRADDILQSLSPPQILASFNAQMAKVVTAMQSGRYSIENRERNGFEPKLFRKVVGHNHPEFSTGRQQDAEEYLRHLFSKFDQYTPTDLPNVVDDFRFKVETRLQDPTDHVRYTEREDTILSVPVPLEDAEEVSVHGTTNRKMIHLEKCLAAAFREEIVENFKSPITKERGSARCSTLMTTFPDFLLLQIRRFAYTDGYTEVKKLDVDILFDEVINLERFKSTGPQPNEKLLPSDVNAEFVPYVNPEYVRQLLEMGFSENASRKAVYITGNSTLENATSWIFDNMENPDFNEVHRDLAGDIEAESGKNSPATMVDVEMAKIDDLVALGFLAHKAKQALKEVKGDLNEVANWLFINGHTIPDTPPNETEEVPDESKSKNFSDGPPFYHLIGFISHMGSSPHSGHYVAHIKRDGKWYLFNDEKVAVSQNPPISLGYIYLLQRKTD